MSWSGLFKFLTGFILAIALLFFAGIGVTRYMITRLSTPPPRPVFDNDPPSVKPASAARPATPSPTRTPSPSTAAVLPPPSPSPSPSEAGAYAARVTEPIGLVLRQDPSRDAGRLGGVDYNQQLTVIETSSDGGWERVRLNGSNVEGWVKAGNTERLN